MSAVGEFEIDSDVASAIAGSAIWFRLLDAELVPETSKLSFLDRTKTLDILCQCQEHDVQPDYADTLSFLMYLTSIAFDVEDKEDAEELTLTLLTELKGCG